MNVEELENVLEKRCKSHWYIIKILILTSTPGIFNGMHLMSYVFLAGNPKYWCDISEFHNTNWTNEQIFAVSAQIGNENIEHSCYKYGWNYTYFAQIGYNEAQKYINKANNIPKKIPCDKFKYEEVMPSIISEWDLICDRRALKSSAQAGIAIGKFAGAILIGPISDRFGRKKSFVACIIMYIISAPIVPFVQSYVLFMILRLFIGFAGGGVYETGYTLITELTVKSYRSSLVCLYNVAYPIGIAILPVLAIWSKSWRQLQSLMSFPLLILLINCYFLTESPRWLMVKGKYNKAMRILYGKNANEINESSIAPTAEERPEKQLWYEKIYSVMTCIINLYTIGEMLKRIIICNFGWYVASFIYFVIVLNVHNITNHPYFYIALNGFSEAPGYIAPLLLLPYIGRKLLGILLFNISGICLLLVIAGESSYYKMTVSLIGRFCICAVYSVFILHILELFPTSHRNTALGTSLTMGQLGFISAPFAVEYLTDISVHIPYILCGVLSMSVGMMIFVLPETKNKPLLDTVEDMKKLNKENKTSCYICCKFK